MTTTPSRADVVVVGAGVVGASAAWRLARRGLDVVVLDQFEAGHAHGSSHGSSRIFRLAYPEAIYVRLARQALTLWRDLEDETSTSVLTLTGATDHGDPVMVDALRAALDAAGAGHEVLTPDAAQERWPMLRFDTTVLFHPDGGRLYADDAVAALLAAATAHGAQVRRNVRVTSIDTPSDDHAIVGTESGDAVEARAAVVAAGGWVGGLVPDLPLPRRRVTQEQTAHFDVDDPSVEWPSFIHHPHDIGHGGRVSPARSGVYGLGDTGTAGSPGVKVGFHAIGPEVDPRQPDRTADADTHHDLQRYAQEWMPGARLDTAEPTTCLYTQTPDHHFVIDRRGPIVVAAGFSGHGFKFGPALGELIAGLALDGAVTPSLFAFGPRSAS